MKNSPRLFLAAIIAAISVSTTFAVNPVVQTNTAGPTTFISNVTLGNISTNLSSIVFSILPMHGATAKPISATYSKAYLARTNRLNTTNGTATIPVFGLYQNYTNSVVITCIQGGAATTQVTSIKTPKWTDPDGYLSQLTVYIPRKPSVSLGYSFMEMKYTASGITPVILDTDGEIRWVGTANYATQSSIFYQNSFFLGTGTKLTRMELDGSTNTIADYSTNYGVTSTQHHTYDPGKTGILLEVSTTNYLESSILEVTTNGTVLNNFDFAAIISSAMTNGGDVATNFVRPASNASPDWFHNNAATYWRAQDTLVVSSRENFVMGISYTTKKILWILGDTTKAWYQYPSLRAYALTLSPGSNPPIGEHGISITSDGQLMLFDNGRQALTRFRQECKELIAPPGNTRLIRCT